MGESELTEGLPGLQLILSVLTQSIGRCHFHCRSSDSGGCSADRPALPGPSGILDHGTESVQDSYQAISQALSTRV